MRPYLLILPVSFLFGACAGDNHVTEQSPAQPARMVAGNESRVPNGRGAFARNRVYQITRLETADQKRGEWRASGETIRQNGSTIQFTELGSGKTVQFTAPHQITAMRSTGDRITTQFNNEDNSEVSSASQPNR